MTAIQWKWAKFSGLILGLVGVVVAMPALGVRWSDLTPERLRAYLLSFGWWAPVVYLLLYAQPIIPLPASVMSMAGGLSFGILGGFLAALISAMIRACGQFVIAKWCGRDAIATLLRGRLIHLDRALGEQGFWAVLWIRLVPNLPYDLQNFGLGCSRIPFRPFALATLLALIPALFFWVYLGQALTGTTPIWKSAVAVLGLLTLALVQHRFRHPSLRRPQPPVHPAPPGSPIAQERS